ncbi:MAG: glutathione S-transferase family protein [Paucibacter sp.]|nr:glutathione S-transferase family protein [Roseateles sp.]
MMELWHCVSARSFRPLWLIEELGLECELRMLPFPPRSERREYLNENPLGTVPLLVDGATRMSESAAICQYLAARRGSALNVAVSESEYGAFLNFLHFGEATLTFPQTLVLRYRYFEPAERRQPQVAEDYARWFLSRLRSLEGHLGESREFLCAGRFTAADVSVGYALMLASHLGFDVQFPPAVAAYWQRLRARPAFSRALEREREAAIAQGIDCTPSPDLRA